jgi:hypothetical protein
LSVAWETASREAQGADETSPSTFDAPREQNILAGYRNANSVCTTDSQLLPAHQPRVALPGISVPRWRTGGRSPHAAQCLCQTSHDCRFHKDFPVRSATTLPALAPADWIAWFSQGFGNQGFGNQPGFGGQPGGSSNPYSGSFGPSQPPRKKSNAWLWILGVVGLGGLLICGCCGGFGYFAFSQGMTMFANEARQRAEGDPAIVQHIGEINSVTTNFIKSTQETEKRGSGQSFLVFDVKGSKGSGELIGAQARQAQPGAMFDSLELRIPSGEVIPIQ